MAQPRVPDQLSLDAAEARKAGMSYGKWKAIQGAQNVQRKDHDTARCEFCGTLIRLNPKCRRQFCDERCRSEFYNQRKREYMQQHRYCGKFE